MLFFPLYSVSNQLRKFLALLVAILIFTSACKTGSKSDPNPTSPKTDFSIPVTSVSANADLAVSQKPEDKELCRSIGNEIDKRDAPTENWGVVAVSLADGRITCARNPKKLFLPASVQKLVTAAVALDRLEPGFRLKTSVYSKSPPVNGTVDGDLTLYGRGAPDFERDSISKLIDGLKKKGVKRISGNVIGDESYFKGDGLGDGWAWNEAQWYYGAAASALSFGRNQATVTIKDGKPAADSEFVELSGELKPVESIEAVGIKRKLGTNEVYVWGNGKDLTARIAVADPALFAARILKESLEKSGIKVEGQSRSNNWKQPIDIEAMVELASVESEPPADTVKKMNRDSVNLYAELLLRTLGKKFGSEAPDADPKTNLLRGDDRAGTSVVMKWLADKKLATHEIAVHDGSGLSRLDRLSPELITRVLILAAQSNYAPGFIDSLPVSGESGTLRGRLNNVKGKIAAKTGSIKYVNSLAGYAKNGNETFAFAVICNDETFRNDSATTIDAIASMIAGRLSTEY